MAARLKSRLLENGLLTSGLLKNGLVQIHGAVFLFGLAGLFGKFIDASPVYIVLGRTLSAAMVLGIWVGTVSGTPLRGFGRTALGLLSLQGALLAAHWYLFFQSIQVSSVAVGLVTFSSFPLFVTFLEPLVFREPLQPRDVILAIVVFAGICLVVPDMNPGNQVTMGAVYGILSGLTFAVLALLNRKNVRASDPVAVAFFQNGFAAICLVPVALAVRPMPPAISDLPALIFLGVACTALAHTLFIASLRRVRAQTASVITGLEPVYGIFLAFFLLGEIPELRTLGGGILIIGATVAAGIFSHSERRQHE